MFYGDCTVGHIRFNIARGNRNLLHKTFSFPPSYQILTEVLVGIFLNNSSKLYELLLN